VRREMKSNIKAPALGREGQSAVTDLDEEGTVRTRGLSGPDLCYWVARANAQGSGQDGNVVRSHYGESANGDPADEASSRAFVESKLGPVLPHRGLWR